VNNSSFITHNSIMPGLLLNMMAQVTCSHAGKVQLVAPNPRVLLNGVPAPLIASPFVVAGCTMPPPPAGNGPDASGTWILVSGTTRVTSMGQPLVVQSTQSTCLVTGAPGIIVEAGQMKVSAI
jgi:hypothetical protein